jgi:hypothetical protein
LDSSLKVLSGGLSLEQLRELTGENEGTTLKELMLC